MLINSFSSIAVVAQQLRYPSSHKEKDGIVHEYMVGLLEFISKGFNLAVKDGSFQRYIRSHRVTKYIDK